MWTRRQFLQAAGAATLWTGGRVPPVSSAAGTVVNDVQSQLNATRVDRVARPRSVEEVQRAILAARSEGKGISISGGRHAMGGQQFGVDTVLLDMNGMDRVLSLDTEHGQIEVQAGIQWPALIDYLILTQRGQARQWGITQKQTGADRFSIGGSLGANIHGRGLRMKPFVGDVESFVLVDADGAVRACDRRKNRELFQLAIGGYGLFGVITSVKLRLAPRRKLRRVVEVLLADDLMPAFERRIAEGFLYGDFQFSVDRTSEGFLRKGVFSCYEPVDDRTPIPDGQEELSREDWQELIHLLHVDPTRAFERYSQFYLASSGQIYWSDEHQLSLYIDDYHQRLDRKLGAGEKATEVITEIYVPRPALTRFLEDVREEVRRERIDVIYGTIRVVERDDESFLAWAKEPYACTIFNLHTVHSPEGLERSGRAFRRLIDLGIAHGGSYYLTYHRFATRAQVETCYPRFPEFLRLKREHDPEERFQSEWYRHHRQMFADAV
jgi:FAD/FMN-containing dehydrogenase